MLLARSKLRKIQKPELTNQIVLNFQSCPFRPDKKVESINSTSMECERTIRAPDRHAHIPEAAEGFKS